MLQGSLTILAFGILYWPLSDTRQTVPEISKIFLWALELYKRKQRNAKGYRTLKNLPMKKRWEKKRQLLKIKF